MLLLLFSLWGSRLGGFAFFLGRGVFHFAATTTALRRFAAALAAAIMVFDLGFATAALLFATTALGFATAALFTARAARFAALMAAAQETLETTTAAAMALEQVATAAAAAAVAFDFAATAAAAATAEEGESIARKGQRGHDQSDSGKVHSNISIRVRLPAVTSPAWRTPITG
ncbi:MAG: hypothetical protein U0805_19955 [Pirellulales bacterium]